MNNQHGAIPILLVVVIVVGMIALGMTGYFFYSTMKNTNESADTNAGLANRNTNSGASANTNANTSASLETVSVVDAVNRAVELNGKKVCLTGEYRLSFEYSVIRGSSQVGGGSAGSELEVWTDLEPLPRMTCEINNERQQTCSATVTMCGTFWYDGGEKPWFGHLGAYRYMLQ